MNNSNDIFEMPLDVIPKIGPARKKALNELGIFTINDLLTYYPYRFEDLNQRNPNETLDGQKVVFVGEVISEPTLSRFGYKKSRVSFRLLIDDQVISIVFFNQPWIKTQIELNSKIAVFGTYDRARQSLSANKIVQQTSNELEPIYTVSKSIKQKTIKEIIQLAFNEFQDKVDDVIPKTLIDEYDLMHRVEQIQKMHFPTSLLENEQARYSASFEEFFLFQMRLQLIKKTDKEHLGHSTVFNQEHVERFIEQLPFELTLDQKKVTDEILLDLKRNIHMNRLLQGDVGSGKTIVAAIAMFAVNDAGKQAALMAPTEILAQQHAQNIGNLFSKIAPNIRVELLTGSMKPKIRKYLLDDLKNGEIDIVIGTHALIQDDVEFHQLGLAVIDEQHRFGVKQRAKLREIGQNPDMLSMTATPIPRTLAITEYGELDISTINVLPNGRKPIKTRWVKSDKQESVVDWLKKRILEKNDQAYIVVPLIEESEVLDVQNLQNVFETFEEEFGSQIPIKFLHGRMDSEEKNQIMDSFKKNETKILVATSVIEVGVDVPNANIILILDADRFGLAQLHQLRGRVGRGEKQSFAILIADPKTEYGIKRLQAIEESNDGFKLSQIDLELRGSGDVLGVQQSGEIKFNVADPIKDIQLLENAQQEAINIVENDEWDKKEENQKLVNYLSQTMQQYKNFD